MTSLHCFLRHFPHQLTEIYGSVQPQADLSHTWSTHGRHPVLKLALFNVGAATGEAKKSRYGFFIVILRDVGTLAVRWRTGGVWMK